MSGVIIGVTSVITVVSIAQGVKQQVKGQINKLGQDLITVRATPVGVGASGSQGLGVLATFNVVNALPAADYTRVSRVSGVASAVPLSLLDGQIKGDQVIADNVVIGTTDQLPDALNQPLAYGVFFTTDEADTNVAVLGQRAAQRIFSENVPLGRSFSFRGEQFIVRGVFDAFDATPLSGAADLNDAVFIPYDIAGRLSQNAVPLFEVLARPSDPKQVDRAVKAIDSQLLKAHGGQHDFTVQKPAQSLAASNTILDLLTKLVAGMAAISLLVGGVGIMNVMLVSVTERMHEIGIRKAVGATNRQVLNQFLVEATVLSVVGGLFGILAAGIIDIVLRIFTSLQPIISWQIVLLAVGISVVIGMVFGSAPAIKAARRQPIDALRNE